MADLAMSVGRARTTKAGEVKCYDCALPAAKGYTRCDRHRQLSSQRAKEWKRRNMESYKAKAAARYQEDKERIKAAARKWSAENKERKRAAGKKWAAKNPDRVLNSRMKKFGLTAAKYHALLDEQGGVCAICGSAEAKGRGRMHVDHCHDAEERLGVMVVRGLLCNTCNLGVGYFKNDIGLLFKAAAYLADAPKAET